MLKTCRLEPGCLSWHAHSNQSASHSAHVKGRPTAVLLLLLPEDICERLVGRSPMKLQRGLAGLSRAGLHDPRRHSTLWLSERPALWGISRAPWAKAPKTGLHRQNYKFGVFSTGNLQTFFLEPSFNLKVKFNICFMPKF